MDTKRQQALVGLFVVVAAGLLLATIFAITGAFGRGGVRYTASFPYVAGLEPGATVRFGGTKAGRVEQLRVDPQDPSRIEVAFTVQPGVPVKTDSVAKITSLGALGDNYLEIATGSANAPRAPAGSRLKSKEYFGIGELSETLSTVSPEVKQLVENVNQRVSELQVTIARTNDLLSDKNRTELSASLGHVRGMLEEDRPKLKTTLANMETASAKLPALLDDFKKTVKQADDALAHIDAVIGENRSDLRGSITELRQTLRSASELVGQIDRTLYYNSENIDELLENLRHTTENLKQFTDTIKARPYTLIRAAPVPDHKPGQSPR